MQRGRLTVFFFLFTSACLNSVHLLLRCSFQSSKMSHCSHNKNATKHCNDTQRNILVIFFLTTEKNTRSSTQHVSNLHSHFPNAPLKPQELVAPNHTNRSQTHAHANRKMVETRSATEKQRETKRVLQSLGKTTECNETS